MMTEAEFEREWERCKGWIDAALHRGGDCETLDDVHRKILGGEYEFWPGVDSAIVTRLIYHAAGKEYCILLAGGKLDTLRVMLPSVEAFAQQLGCAIITILGRRGWERSFLTREGGYKAVATLLGKPLHVEGQ